MSCLAALLLISVLVFGAGKYASANEDPSAHHHKQHPSQPLRALLPSYEPLLLHQQKLLHKENYSPATTGQGQKYSQDPRTVLLS